MINDGDEKARYPKEVPHLKSLTSRKKQEDFTINNIRSLEKRKRLKKE